MNQLPLVDALLGRRSLLSHPFYVRWSEGRLTRPELAGYAREYYALVQSLPTFISHVRTQAPEAHQAELLEHEMEEKAHIALWADFAKGLGVSETALAQGAVLPETKAALETLEGLAKKSYAEGALALYTVEKAAPEVSETKLEGLKAHYGMARGKATAYFEVHAVRDVAHAQSWARLIAALDVSKAFMEVSASRAIDAQHQLLDGCERAFCDSGK